MAVQLLKEHSVTNGRATNRILHLAVVGLLALWLSNGDAYAQALPYAKFARRIASALKVWSGERVLLRFDPKTLPALLPEVRKALEAEGAKVDTLAYGPAPDLDARLASTDVYIWLPAGPTAQTPPDQAATLAKWLDRGAGREIHFHWGDGTRDPDGLSATHTPAFDKVYADALEIDYGALAAAIDRAGLMLRSGVTRVTTPAGTDLRFRVADRPFNKQDGDASKGRMTAAKVRVDREIELPAGVLRVAPLEVSVNGVIVIPAARFGAVRATNIRLVVDNGVVTSATAQEGAAALRDFLKSEPGASHFREFALGFNPKLVAPPGVPAIAYYGYGAGCVRLSLGDNEELGGEVRGGGVRWLFFPDATVMVGERTLVDGGKLSFDFRFQIADCRLKARD